MLSRFATLNHLFPATDGGESLLRAVIEDAPPFLRDVEAAGFTGVLIFAANRLPDPFFVAQIVMRETTTLVPLIALRADLAHPFEIYNRLVALAVLGQRPVYLNLIAGSNRYENIELGDNSHHDDRFLRLRECATVLRSLIAHGGRCRHSGRFFNLDIDRPMVRPGWPDIVFYVSGSSDSAVCLSQDFDAVRLAPWQAAAKVPPQGVPLGILARSTQKEAWEAANKAFPHINMASEVPELVQPSNDAQWRSRLVDEGLQLDRSSQHSPVWWYEPFLCKRLHHNGRRSNHPWLVGAYRDVGEELNILYRQGVTDIVIYQEDVGETEHIKRALAQFGPD